MFGGYNPALPFYAEPTSGVCYGFHYFSATFILDQSSPAPRWRQVITPSFPTYRAQGQLLTDPATGKMYLFGGYTNTDWVPAGKSEVTRSYGDIWQLVVDVPGGLFEGIDWEDEKRTAQLGPWQVCYVCNAVGIHKKCGGALSVRYYVRCAIVDKGCDPRVLRRTGLLLYAHLSARGLADAQGEARL